MLSVTVNHTWAGTRPETLSYSEGQQYKEETSSHLGNTDYLSHSQVISLIPEFCGVKVLLLSCLSVPACSRHAELFIGRSCRLLRCGGKTCPDNTRHKSALSVSPLPLEVYVLKT